MVVRAAAVLIIAVSCGLMVCPVCVAQVQLPTVNLGITNFEDGFAAPGWLFEVFPEFYDADELRNSRGNTVSGRNRLTANSATTHLVFVSYKQFLGGWLSFEALQPWVDVDVRLADASASRVHGLADLTVAGGLQWAPREIGSGVFVHRLMLAVGVPTGKYSDEQPLNLGNHFVVLDPYYALTYELQKLEFSARLHYLWNSVNHDPFVGFGVYDVQAGQAFHMNYAASYEAIKDVRVGLNGYWLQQTTDHKSNGVDIPGSLERTVGLGGGIQIFFGRQTWFHFNANWETEVRNRARGFSVILRVTKGIPSAKTEG